MELFGFALFIAFVYIICRLVHATWCWLTRLPARRRQGRIERFEQQARRAEAERRQGQQRANLNRGARELQVALLRLDDAPDFRRAASFAAHAKAIPVAFRQRQFRRFRPRLVQHMAARLTAGEDREVLVASLRELVTHLGVASFEGDYICEEAERSLARPENPQADFRQQLHVRQRDHERRLQAIRELPALSSELREQMLEAEQERFRDEMLRSQGEQNGQREGM